MANPAGGQPKPGPGRPKGSKDKLPRDLKDRVLAVWDHLAAQGKDLQDVAEADPPWFYANFIKPMLPKDVKLDADVKLRLTDDQLKSRLSDLLRKAGAA